MASQSETGWDARSFKITLYVTLRLPPDGVSELQAGNSEEEMMSEESSNTEMFAAAMCDAADTKRQLSDETPKHRCGKPGDRWRGFAPLDSAS